MKPVFIHKSQNLGVEEMLSRY